MAVAMAMETNRQIWGEGGPLLEAVTGATADASLEARWLVESLGGGEDFVSGQGKRGITISYVRPVRGGRLLLLCQSQKLKGELA